MIEISTRPLTEADWMAFRDIRLFALKTEPGVFSSTYLEESKLTPEDWRSRVDAADRQLFGLFVAGELRGITAVFTWQDDPSHRTALLAMSYLRPEYRGQGLVNLFYSARLGWVESTGRYERVVVSHRESNRASSRAIQRHGFNVLRREPRIWPDGIAEDEIWYELRVQQRTVARPS